MAGVAGLVWSAVCSTNSCVRDRIQSTADKIPGTGSAWGDAWAHGRINAYAAVGSPGGSVPSLSITDVSVSEGNTGTTNAQFSVTLSAHDRAVAAQCVAAGYSASTHRTAGV